MIHINWLNVFSAEKSILERTSACMQIYQAGDHVGLVPTIPFLSPTLGVKHNHISNSDVLSGLSEDGYHHHESYNLS